MTWYRSGSVTVTNNSVTVSGSGTAWSSVSDNAIAGSGFRGPDGRMYEIAGIGSDTNMTLMEVYAGGTASGQPYAIMPTPGLAGDLAKQIALLVSSIKGTVDGATPLGKGLLSVTDASTARALIGANGRYLNTRYISGSGAYIKTPGTTAAEIWVQGAGGGGGGAPATGAGGISVGTGGNSGALAVAILTGTQLDNLAVTIGAGGAGGNAGPGGKGGDTTFGNIAAGGGEGGTSAGPYGGPLIVTPASNLATTQNANIFSAASGAGGMALILRFDSACAGAGADSWFGRGPVGRSIPGGGGSANNRGAGGGGALVGNSASAFSGGVGGAGVVLVREFG